MRRADREITDPREVAAVLRRQEVARVAFSDHGQPYVVPLFFVLAEVDREAVLYFHCADAGRKLEILQENDRVAFEVDGDVCLLSGKDPCDWSATFESVVGTGRMSVVSDPDERVRGLDLLMHRYGIREKPVYRPEVLACTVVLKLSVMTMTGKRKQRVVTSSDRM